MTYFSTARAVVLGVALTFLAQAACDGRGIGSGPGQSTADAGLDAAVAVDAAGDAAVAATCDRQDAVQVGNGCPVGQPLGWGWSGSGCEAIYCQCAGEDCDQLHESESACLSAYAASCLPLNPCINLAYDQCEATAGCGLVWYGGGCFDMAQCDPPDGEGFLCIEQAYGCVPTDEPCQQRARDSCDGDCHWVSFELELCFGQCCQPEGFGYCESNTLPQTCGPQRIDGCPDACANVVGYSWNGSDCAPIQCCCMGPDCGETFATLDACYAARGPMCQGCLDPTDPNVSYVQFGSCADIDWDCITPGWQNFENECGCGCRLTPQP